MWIIDYYSKHIWHVVRVQWMIGIIVIITIWWNSTSQQLKVPPFCRWIPHSSLPWAHRPASLTSIQTLARDRPQFGSRSGHTLPPAVCLGSQERRPAGLGSKPGSQSQLSDIIQGAERPWKPPGWIQEAGNIHGKLLQLQKEAQKIGLRSYQRWPGAISEPDMPTDENSRVLVDQSLGEQRFGTFDSQPLHLYKKFN